MRLARAGSWAAAALGLSVGAHLVGGGDPPSPGAAALIAVALLWSGFLLTQRRLGRTMLVATLGLSQLLLHAVLTAVEVPSTCAGSGGHHEMAAMACTSGAPMGHDVSATMLVAHAVAALLLGLVLARGEDAIWQVAGLLWPRLPAPAVLPALMQDALVPAHGDRPARRPFVLGGVGRRGPPAGRAPAVA